MAGAANGHQALETPKSGWIGHCVRVLDPGMDVIIGADDPSISQITLTGKNRRACQDLGTEYKRLEKPILAAAQARILPEAESLFFFHPLFTPAPRRWKNS